MKTQEDCSYSLRNQEKINGQVKEETQPFTELDRKKIALTDLWIERMNLAKRSRQALREYQALRKELRMEIYGF